MEFNYKQWEEEQRQWREQRMEQQNILANKANAALEKIEEEGTCDEGCPNFVNFLGIDYQVIKVLKGDDPHWMKVELMRVPDIEESTVAVEFEFMEQLAGKLAKHVKGEAQ